MHDHTMLCRAIDENMCHNKIIVTLSSERKAFCKCCKCYRDGIGKDIKATQTIETRMPKPEGEW